MMTILALLLVLVCSTVTASYCPPGSNRYIEVMDNKTMMKKLAKHQIKGKHADKLVKYLTKAGEKSKAAYMSQTFNKKKNVIVWSNRHNKAVNCKIVCKKKVQLFGCTYTFDEAAVKKCKEKRGKQVFGFNKQVYASDLVMVKGKSDLDSIIPP